jgi:ABC-type transporter Mla subunit MlaD
MVKALLVIAAMMSLLLLGCVAPEPDVTPEQDIETEPGLGQDPGLDQEQQGFEQGGGVEPGLEQERQQFQENIENELNALDTRLNELSQQASQLPAENRPEFNQRMEQLKQQRADIGDRLDQITEVTEQEWQNFTAEIEQAVEDLQRSTNDLAEAFNL